MFVAVLLTVAKTWKQPRCPLTRQMNKEDVVYIELSCKKQIKFCYLPHEGPGGDCVE